MECAIKNKFIKDEWIHSLESENNYTAMYKKTKINKNYILNYYYIMYKLKHENKIILSTNRKNSVSKKQYAFEFNDLYKARNKMTEIQIKMSRIP